MLLMMLSALCAYFVKGMCGFANTLVFSTMMSFGANNVDITPLELLLGYPSNIILALRERRHIQWRICAPVALVMLIGCIPGMLLLKNTDSRLIKLAFGAVIVLIGGEMLLRDLRPRSAGTGSRAMLGAIGLLSGLLCGLYGIGALLAAYMSRVTRDSRAFRANMCAVFIVENTFRIAAFAALGLIGAQTLLNAALLLPAMALGLFLGIKCSARANERVIKRAVIVLLMLSGVMLILQNMG
ncbi:MAG: TSUP family transporter [Candidatus Fimadaptatus sp.]